LIEQFFDGGYCPESSCCDAVEDALWLAGIEHPGGFTSAFELRRCPGCGERNLVKDEYYVCAACDPPLPQTWNFGADAPSVNDGDGAPTSSDPEGHAGRLGPRMTKAQGAENAG
jgi:hypothetical protein